MQILVTRVKTRLRLKKNALLHVTIEYKTTFRAKTYNTVNSFSALDTTTLCLIVTLTVKLSVGFVLPSLLWLLINVVQTL